LQRGLGIIHCDLTHRVALQFLQPLDRAFRLILLHPRLIQRQLERLQIQLRHHSALVDARTFDHRQLNDLPSDLKRQINGFLGHHMPKELPRHRTVAGLNLDDLGEPHVLCKGGHRTAGKKQKDKQSAHDRTPDFALN
jgi:hypothetical protein